MAPPRGAFVNKDDLLVDIETDKVVIEVYAPADGVLMSILKNEGDLFFQTKRSVVSMRMARRQLPKLKTKWSPVQQTKKLKKP